MYDTATGGAIPDNTYRPFIQGGWTCTYCGQWVANTASHTCQWYWSYGQQTRLTDEDIERIARKLAELLRADLKRLGPGLGIRHV